MTMADNYNKVLIIGGGPTTLGSENELDAAAFEKVIAFKKMGTKVLYLDNNPFSVVADEIQAANVFFQTINLENIINIITKEHPDAILFSVAGLLGQKLALQLYQSGILESEHVAIIGNSLTTFQTVADSDRLRQLLTDWNEPVIASRTVASDDDAVEFVREIGFPVIVKPLSTDHDTSRIICFNMDDLEAALQYSFDQTYIKRCSIEQSIVGFKEIEMVGIRDVDGNKILVTGLENMDPIGIHSGDSIIFAPTQTLINEEYQRLRTATFKIMDALNITGSCHIQFAQSRTDSDYFVTKISPYFTRNTALATKATAYPIAYVSTFLEVGHPLAEVRLPSKYSHIKPLLEPTLDHILVKIPLWPFEDIPDADQHLDTVMKSVGSTIGIGRTVEEAIIKAMHSSQFSPRDILPSVQNIDDDDVINQLIHPLASRILILIEALRRGFSIDDLAELTKIDQFYFYKLKQLIFAQTFVQTNPLTAESIKMGHQYGFGDGMLAELWNTSIQTVEKLNQDNNVQVTYKEVESSAGEFIENTNIFYSSYELENESQPFETDSALVIGRGGNQLGPNAAADYYTSQVLIQLHKSGYKTIVLNNNPNAVSMSPQLSDKQYIEPIQLGNILNIIRLERPKVIVLPGNRHYLAKNLKQRDELNIIVLPPDQKDAQLIRPEITNAVDYFIDGNVILPITTISYSVTSYKRNQRYNTNYQQPMNQFTQYGQKLIAEGRKQLTGGHWQGLVQVLFEETTPGNFKFAGIRPIRITETAFLTKATGINWVRVLVKKNLGNLDLVRLAELLSHTEPKRFAIMNGIFPFEALHARNHQGSSKQEVGASLQFKNIDQQKKE